MSRKKLADHVREEQAARRDYRRLQDGPDQEKKLLADDTSPSQQVALNELLREFRTRLSPEERRLADLRASGQNWAQIAAEIGDGAEALRKKLTRAIDRIASKLGLDAYDDEGT
jgi:hypothetical protein